MKSLREPGWEEGGEVCHPAKLERAQDLDESTLLDGPALPAPRAVGRVKPALLHIDQHEIDLQVRIAEQRGDADELGEDVARDAVPR